MVEIALGHPANVGTYLRKLFPKIDLRTLTLTLTSETISEDTYLCWMSECECRLWCASSVHEQAGLFRQFLGAKFSVPQRKGIRFLFLSWFDPPPPLVWARWQMSLCPPPSSERPIDIYLSGLLARRQNTWSQNGGNMRVIANGVNR